jgi:hypothetical protein
MTIDLWIEIAIVCLIFWAVWKSIPKNPDLNWKYFHSLVVATLIRGELETVNAASEDWLKEIKILVSFHPDFAGVNDIFIENNETPEQKWQEWFHDDDVIEKHLMDDPEILGANFKPSALITWQDLAEQNDVINQTLLRKFAHAIIVGQSSRAKEFADLLNIPLYSDVLDIDKLSDAWKEKKQRFIFVGQDDECQEMLVFMHEFPAVRDRVLSMIFVDGKFDTEWLNSHFTHEKMDAEANHAIPYILWSYIDPASIVPWQTIPKPPEPTSNWYSIEIIDLGPFSHSMRDHSSWMNQSICILIAKRMELL